MIANTHGLRMLGFKKIAEKTKAIRYGSSIKTQDKLGFGSFFLFNCGGLDRKSRKAERLVCFVASNAFVMTNALVRDFPLIPQALSGRVRNADEAILLSSATYEKRI